MAVPDGDAMIRLTWLLPAMIVVTFHALAADNLEPLSWFGQPHTFHSLSVLDDYLYAGSSTGNVEIFRLDQQRVIPLTTIPLMEGSWHLLGASAGYLFAATYVSYEGLAPGFQLYDLREPASPRKRTFISGEGFEDVCFCPPYLYTLEDNDSGTRLVVHDLHDPSLAPEVGSLTLYGSSNSLAGAGDRLVLIDEAGLRVIDISQPANPRFIGSYRPANWSPLYYPRRPVTVENDIAVVHTDEDLEIIDISDPTTPVSSAIILDENIQWHGVSDHVLAYFSESYPDHKLIFYDINDPSAPRKMSSIGFPLNQTVNSFRFQDHYLIVTADDGLAVLEVADPAAPSLIYHLNAGPVWLALYPWNSNLALVSEDTLAIYEVSNPARPTLLSLLAMDGSDYFTEVRVSQGILLAAGNGLQIVDVSNPVMPHWLAEVYYNFSSIRRFETYGAFAYLATDMSPCNIHVIDLSDPSNPRETASFEIEAEGLSLVRNQDVLYVGVDGTRLDNQLRVYDLSNPRFPRLIEVLELGNAPTGGLAVDSDRLFAAGYFWSYQGSQGVDVYDVADPRRPAFLYSIETVATGMPKTGNGLLVRGEGNGWIGAYDVAALPQVMTRGAVYQFNELRDLEVAADGVIWGLWGGDRWDSDGDVGAFRVSDAPKVFLGSVSVAGSTTAIRAWTAHPGISQVELTYDGLATGVFLQPQGDGWFELQLEIPDGVPDGQYLLGLRGEGCTAWRPEWPYVPVD